MCENFNDIPKSILTINYLMIWFRIIHLQNVSEPLSSIIANFLHKSSVLGSVLQIWKIPVFQYSKLSVRCYAPGSSNSNSSKPTELPELSQATCTLLKFAPKILLKFDEISEESSALIVSRLRTLKPNTSSYQFTALLRLITLTPT